MDVGNGDCASVFLIHLDNRWQSQQSRQRYCKKAALPNFCATFYDLFAHYVAEIGKNLLQFGVQSVFMTFAALYNGLVARFGILCVNGNRTPLRRSVGSGVVSDGIGRVRNLSYLAMVTSSLLYGNMKPDWRSS